MKGTSLKALLLSVAFATLMAQSALAATPACTSITNTATLAYDVGGIGQDVKTSNDGVCTTANNCAFYVGVKVGVTVATTDAAYVSVTPNGTAYELNFTVTNDGNATMQFGLAPTSKGAGSWDSVFSAGNEVTVVDSDSFAMNTVTIRDADNADADITATGIASLDAGLTRNIKIFANAPATGVDTNVDVLALVAQAKWLGSSAEVTTEDNVSGNDIGGPTCGPLAATTVEVVLADAEGKDDNGARKGDHSARSAYKVSSAVISVAKTVDTIWDPVNFNNGAKSIPEAITEYTITIANAGGAGAQAILSTITDNLDTANLDLVTTFYDGGLGSNTPTSSTNKAFIVTCSAGCGNRACETGTTFTADTADGILFNTPTITATMGTVLPDEDSGSCDAGVLEADDSVTIKFQTKIK